MIRVDGLTKSFQGRLVLSGLEFTATPEHPVALMGPNASGKTTALNLVLGLLTPDSGSIVGTHGRRLAAIFQDDRLCEQLSAVGNLRLVLPRHTPTIRITDELAAAGLPRQAATQPVAQLSGGQRRRVCLARALLAEADVVCLDEPFAGIDHDSRPAVLEYARRRCAGRDLLLTTHDPAEAAWFGATIVRLPQ